MRCQGIWHFVQILLFAICLTKTSGQLVQYPEPENSYRGLGNRLILIIAPPIRSRAKDLPQYNVPLRIEQSDPSSSDEDLKSAPKDEDAYYLYHVLRTTDDRENLDDKLRKTVEKAKSLLLPALRSRCNQLQDCMEMCPPRKKVRCVQKCQIQIDVYSVCEPPPCKLPKCGKTMPPRWKL